MDEGSMGMKFTELEGLESVLPTSPYLLQCSVPEISHESSGAIVHWYWCADRA